MIGLKIQYDKFQFVELKNSVLGGANECNMNVK